MTTAAGRAARVAPCRAALAAALLAAALLAPALLGGLLLAGPPAAASTPPADRVLVIAAPRLTWDLVDAVQPAALLDLLGRSAVASLSVQAATEPTTAADGYLTMGAGNRAATTSPPPEATDEGGGVVVPGTDALDRRNDGLRYGAEPGALGDAMAGAGRPAAVVANADVVQPAPRRHRDAALAVMDGAGRAGGSVAPALAVADASAPGGLRVDEGAVLDVLDRVWRPGSMTLVELSDLERAGRAGTRRELEAALRRSDALVAALVARTDPQRDAVLVVAPVAPHDRAELTVFAVAGPGVRPGQARSATTRRAGYVTLPDVAPTVLAALGVAVPDAMTGTPVTSAGGPTRDPSSTAADRADRDARSLVREQVVVPVAVAFLTLQLVVFAATAVAFRRRAARRWLRVGLLAVVAYPALTLLSGLTRYDRLGRAGYVAALVVAALAVGLAVALLARHRPVAGALGLVVATWLVVVVDGLLGGPLQLDTPFGYSPITAARFAGMGNLGLATLMVTAIVGGTGAWAVWPRGPRWWAEPPDPWPARAPRALLVVTAAAYALSVVVDAAPGAGADLGGVLALLPALAVCWLLLAGVRLTWWRLGLVLVAGVVVAAAAALADLARPAADRTHLGRFARRVLDGEAGPVLARKLSTNLHVLANPGVLAVTVLAVTAAVVTWRRSAPFATVRRQVPGVRAALVASAAGGVLGLAVNDSGIVVPGIMLAVLVPWFAHLAFAVAPPERP